MKKTEDVCGCCGRRLPPPKLEQSLIDTAEWPVIKPEPKPKDGDAPTPSIKQKGQPL